MRIAVLGGGPGGYSAAFEAAQLGAEVTLIERDRLGGTCLNWGCIPTKTILRSAHVVADTRHAESLGLKAMVPTVDIERLRARKERVVDELVSQVEAKAKRLKVDVLYGEGRLTAPKTIDVSSTDGGTVTIDADAVILATGSVVFKLPNIDHDLEGVWTSDDAVAVREIPSEILIIGGGAIGLEFACAYAAFGSTVTVVELMEQVLPGNDKRVVRLAQQKLEEMGVAFHLADAVEAVERVDGRLRSTLRSGTTIESDVVMSAVGRVPNSAGFGFEEAGLEYNRRAVKVDEHFRTNIPGIYAIGDLNGGVMLAHVAEDEGRVAVCNAVSEFEGRAGELETVCLDCVPACIYTFPEIAVVGMTKDAAKERGLDAVQVVAKFAGNAKTLAEGEADGFVQLIAEKGSGAILGCQIVGPHAVEIIHEVIVCIKNGLSVRDLVTVMHAHPTVSETIKHAALDAAAKV